MFSEFILSSISCIVLDDINMMSRTREGYKGYPNGHGAAIACLVLFLSLSSSLTIASFPQDTLHPLRPLTGSGGHPAAGLTCDSWNLGVETNNLRGWITVPASCEGYVGHYMLGDRYREDSLVVAQAAAEYANSLKLAGDGKDVWVFDIDETSLSNLPYFACHGFGVELYNATSFNLYVAKGSAPPLPETLILYKKLLSLRIKIVFLTGRSSEFTKITILNLKRSGYHTWEKLILRKPNIKGYSMAYKSAERQNLVKMGYRIVGNIGDQWSDILGAPEGDRTFKLPDPMYYIS